MPDDTKQAMDGEAVAGSAAHAGHLTLTEAQRELLTMLAEEAAEIVQAASKILRHGPWSFNPDLPPPQRTNNIHDLRRELGDLAAVAFLLDGTGLTFRSLSVEPDAVLRKLRYTRHQK